VSVLIKTVNSQSFIEKIISNFKEKSSPVARYVKTEKPPWCCTINKRYKRKYIYSFTHDE